MNYLCLLARQRFVELLYQIEAHSAARRLRPLESAGASRCSIPHEIRTAICSVWFARRRAPLSPPDPLKCTRRRCGLITAVDRPAGRRTHLRDVGRAVCGER